MTAPFQLFPALDGATEAALRESIQRFGVLVPVVRDQHGRTLDGHHRSRVADDLGVSYRVDVVRVADDDEAREVSRTLNTDRRHMDVEQRREVVAALREHGHSLRAIAGVVGVTKSQIERDLSTVPDGTVPDRVTGLDGKLRPSRRPTVVAAKNEREAAAAQEALSQLDESPATVIDVRRAERLVREQQAARRRSAPTVTATEIDDVTILHGDFRDVLTEHDLFGGVIVTDPPYPREYLDEWRDFAEHGLAWGCRQLIAMCGQSILPDALDLIRKAWQPPTDEYIGEARWRYRWCGAYLTSGPATRVWAADFGSAWKPLLVFDRDDEERRFVITDVFRSTGDDKQHHHWGQNEDGIAAIVEAFTEPGDIVVDPFLGGGTTAIVCRELGRRFVGCDVDAAAVHATRERLAA